MCWTQELCRNIIAQAKHVTHIVNRNLTHSMPLEETEFIWNMALNKALFKLEEKHINIAE